MPEPSTTGVLALVIAKALDASGIRGDEVLRSVGIPADLPNDPTIRLPIPTISALYAASVEHTGDPYFGLTVARFIHLTHMHTVGHALGASASLMDFCQRLQRYWALLSDGTAIELVHSGNEVQINFRLLSDISAQDEVAFLAFLMRTMRHLHTPSLAPLSVSFHHAAPGGDDRPYREVFRAPVAMRQPQPALVFRKSDLEQPLLGANAELARLGDALALQHLVRYDQSNIVAATRQQILEQLPSGRCTRASVARTLHISQPTLQSRLAQHNTSFLALLDFVRRELAISYLRQPSLSMTEITYLLGFSNGSNFTRAFNRWEGMSPTRFRATVTQPKTASSPDTQL